MKNVFIRILHDIKRFSSRYLWICVILGIVNAALPFVTLYFSKEVLNHLIVIQKFDEILPLVLTALCTQAILFLASKYLQDHLNILMDYLVQKFYYSLSEKMMDVEYAYTEDSNMHATARNIKITNYSSQSSFTAIVRRLPIIIQSFFSLIFGVILLVPFLQAPIDSSSSFAILNNPFVLMSLLIVPLIFWFIMFKSQKKFSNKLEEVSGDNVRINSIGNYLTSILLDYNSGKEIRLYKQNTLIKNYLTEMNASTQNFIQKIYSFISAQRFKTAILDFSFQTLTLIFVVIKTIFGSLSLGNVILATGVINILFNNLSSLSSMFLLTLGDPKPLQTYYEYMDLPNHHRSGSLPTEKRIDNEYHFEIKNLSFKYPGSENYALKNISFSFDVGKQFAIVGLNGSGKTTLVKLLCRLYEPTEGEILLNGINIQKYDYSEYVDLFSVVFQDFALLSFSLGENISITNKINEEKAHEALINAGFTNYKDKFPYGLKTFLYKNFDNDGIEISGGEAQKIALARAFYKDAPFVILDEPTAALDPISEYEIYENTHKLLANKTSIYISHRLSSCRFADQILVFNEGQLVEVGSHKELIENNGVYTSLWNAQAQYYIENGYQTLL